MASETSVSAMDCDVYFLPVVLRLPLKFGAESVFRVDCCRVRVVVEDADGRRAEGWGETPLSAPWVWPSQLPHQTRERELRALCRRIGADFRTFRERGHPIDIGSVYMRERLPGLLAEAGKASGLAEDIPWLAALVCFSPFDIAVHDAYANLHSAFVYQTYGSRYMNHDLSWYFDDAERDRFAGKYPEDFFAADPARRLTAWHLVGGADPLVPEQLRGDEPDDGHPVLLKDWIETDGLRCVKIKLSGEDAGRDYARLVDVAAVAEPLGVEWLSADFNCTVTDPAYVRDVLDRLEKEHPRCHSMLLYVEQPFPRDLERHPLDVRSVAERKPLFMDESAHDWRCVRAGAALGWNGVALKTCKTQTGALLSLCWARAHGVAVMVQDLTNPMLAQIPHLLLAAHAGTIMGVETNAMQYYPDASRAEAAVHPAMYRRRDGEVGLESIGATGFGYRLEEMRRVLPPAENLTEREE